MTPLITILPPFESRVFTSSSLKPTVLGMMAPLREALQVIIPPELFRQPLMGK